MWSGPYLQIPIQIWATVLNKTGMFEQKTKQNKKPWRGHAVPEAAAAQTQQKEACNLWRTPFMFFKN